MINQILKFLEKHGVCSLTVSLPDGSIHGAALHFSHSNDPFALYFSTKKTTRKCQGLLNGETVQGSFVVGFSEEEWITVQMDGEVKAILDKNELEKIYKIHYSKHPDIEKYKDQPDKIVLSFTPKWWRYSDYSPDTPIIISSDT